MTRIIFIAITSVYFCKYIWNQIYWGFRIVFTRRCRGNIKTVIKNKIKINGVSKCQ